MLMLLKNLYPDSIPSALSNPNKNLLSFLSYVLIIKSTQKLRSVVFHSLPMQMIVSRWQLLHHQSLLRALPEPSVIEKRISIKESLKLSKQKKEMIYLSRKKNQSDCELWFKERAPRIPGSISGKINNRIKHIYPSSILKSLQTTSSISTASTSRYTEHQRPMLARFFC